ncbi:MAG: transposase [Coleofasciculaceae cyanobacterium]
MCDESRTHGFAREGRGSNTSPRPYPISIEDETVPTPKPLDTVKTAIGIDVGLNKFLTTSEGETVPIQQVYRKAQRHLARQQRKLKRKEKGSNRYESQQNFIAKIHQHIRRQRKDFHYFHNL